jgi:predicted ATPase/DNA-binding SARP family transcriptional activator/Tfp pilus assembly protein PilF
MVKRPESSHTSTPRDVGEQSSSALEWRTVDLQLQLFGAFSAKDALGREIPFRSNKIRALLAYLAVEHERPHRRETLAALLWGNSPDSRARQNLRMALTRLSHSLVLTRVSRGAPLLHITRYTVQLTPSPERHWIDVVEFDRLAQQAAGLARSEPDYGALTGGWLAQAVDLYQGDFLNGLNLPDSPEFDDWRVLIQENYQRQMQSFLDTLSELAFAEGNLARAESYAHQQLKLTPWLESAHAQLMRVYARRGQGQLLQRQYQVCTTILQAELGLVPTPETQALYGQLQTQEQTAFSVSALAQPPAAPPPRYVRHNLPYQRLPFFGRETERATLLRLLRDPAYPLLTVTGPGGIGKTRLMLDAAHDLIAPLYFADGVWFVSCDKLRSAENNLYGSLATSITASLGLELKSDLAPHAQLFAWLDDRKLLLILDNFEQLITERQDGVDFVLDLLAAAPQVKLLISSRRPLDLQMELVLALDGLPVPAAADDQARSYGSIQLFVERGHRSRANFVLDDHTLPEVIDICRSVDGNPLAIELLAVRLREMTCLDITRALRTNLDILDTHLRDVPARHRSLRAVFTWSWNLLTAEQQSCLAQLAVFRGGFTLEAALAVTAARPEMIYSLVTHSLLQEADQRRYRLHEQLRQFAEEKLIDASEVHRHHSQYYLNFLIQRTEPLIHEDLRQAADEVQREWENIQQAWAQAVAQLDIERLGRATTGLGHFLKYSGLFWDGQALFEQAARRIEAELPRVLESELPRWQQALGRVLLGLARSSFWRAEYETTQRLAQQIVELGAPLNDVELIVGGQLEGGRALAGAGKFKEAEVQLSQALRQAPDRSWMKIQALMLCGNVYAGLGNLTRAAEVAQEALHLQQQLNIWHNRSRVVNILAVVHALQGNFQEAQRLLHEALRIARQLGERYMQVTLAHNLGGVHFELGEFETAQSFIQQALDLCEKVQDRQTEASSHLGLGQILLWLVQYEAAAAELEAALQLSRRIGELRIESEALLNMALVQRAMHNLPEAIHTVRHSQQIARTTGSIRLIVDAWLVEGQCHLSAGNIIQARASFETALAQYDRVVPLRQFETLIGLAAVELASGHEDKAASLIERAWPVYVARGSLLGAVLPFEAYWMCYQVLAQQGDSRAAGVLNSAHALLEQQAARLSSAERRAAFLAVPLHRKILARAQAP